MDLQTCGRQSWRSRPSAKIRQATQILPDFLGGNAVVFRKRGRPSVTKNVRNFIENRPKMRPGPPLGPLNEGRNPKMATSGVPSQFFLAGSRFGRLGDLFLDVFLPILGPPGDPKNRPGEGHERNLGLQGRSPDAKFSRLGKKHVSDSFSNDFRFKNGVEKPCISGRHSHRKVSQSKVRSKVRMRRIIRKIQVRRPIRRNDKNRSSKRGTDKINETTSKN